MPMATVNGIRKAFAKGIKDKAASLFVGMSSGNALWGIQQIFTGSFAADPLNTLSLGSANIKNVIVKTTNEVTTYTEGVDYTVDLTTAIVTRMITGNIPNAGAVKVFYYLDNAVKPSKTALLNPLGLKKATQVEFLQIDPLGTITNSSGTFSITSNITNILLIRASFLEADYGINSVREFGVFLDSVVEAGNPPNFFYGPSKITSYGTPLLFSNDDAITVGDINKEWTLII